MSYSNFRWNNKRSHYGSACFELFYAGDLYVWNQGLQCDVNCFITSACSRIAKPLRALSTADARRYMQ